MLHAHGVYPRLACCMKCGLTAADRELDICAGLTPKLALLWGVTLCNGPAARTNALPAVHWTELQWPFMHQFLNCLPNMGIGPWVLQRVHANGSSKPQAPSLTHTTSGLVSVELCGSATTTARTALDIFATAKSCRDVGTSDGPTIGVAWEGLAGIHVCGTQHMRCKLCLQHCTIRVTSSCQQPGSPSEPSSIYQGVGTEGV